jgi:hypothetical protein
MNLQLVVLVGLGLVVYAVLRLVSAQRKAKAGAARYQKMLKICAANGGVPGPVDIPGTGAFGPAMEALAANGIPVNLVNLINRLSGLSNQFSNAADFYRVEEKTKLFFTMVTARFPGINMPHISVTRKGLPGTPVWGQFRIEVESIAFTQRFNVTAQDNRLGFMLLDLPMIQWILDCADVNFDMVGDGLMAYVYRAEEGAPILNRAFELRPTNTDGSELELLYRFVNGFGQRIPALIKAEFAAPAQ